MGVTLITGHSGAGHITSADAGRLIAGVVGLDRYVLPTGKKFAYTIISNNEIDIADGDLVDQGRHITLPQNEVEVVQIEIGEQNKERIDTIAIKYTMDASSGIESASMVLKKGTPVTIGSGTAAPAALTTGNIYAGATEDETALYYVYISGITITKVVQSFVVRESLAVLKSDITALNNGLIDIAYVDITLTFTVDIEDNNMFYKSIDVNEYIPSGYRMLSLLSTSSIPISMWFWLRNHTGEITFCSTTKLNKATRSFRLYLIKNAKPINN